MPQDDLNKTATTDQNDQSEEPSFPLEDFVSSDVVAPTTASSTSMSQGAPPQTGQVAPQAPPIAPAPSTVAPPSQSTPPQNEQATGNIASASPLNTNSPPSQASLQPTDQPSQSTPQTTPSAPPNNQPPPPVPASAQTTTTAPQAPSIPPKAPQASVTAPQAPSIPQNKIGNKAIIRRSGSVARTLLISLISLLALVAVFFFFFYRATITLNISPEGYQASVDGKQISTKTIKVNPGFHTLKIEKDGYVSYMSSKSFSIAEQLNVDIEMKKATVAEIVISGARTLDLSKSGNFVNFLGGDSRLYSIAIDQQNAEPITLSAEQFPTLRKIKYSPNNDFALILDDENLKIADFNKIDPTVQEESTDLPPSASAINTFSWNELSSNFVKIANSKLLYDLKTPSSWDLFMMDLSTLQSQIIMRIDANSFPSLNVHWGESAKTALVTGKKAGLLDIGKREFTPFEEEFVYGEWSKEGQYALLQKADFSLSLLKNTQVSDLQIKSKTFFLAGTNELYFLDNNSPTLINFDSGARINYAEVNGLKDASSFVVSGDILYFLDKDGIKSTKLQRGVYGESQQENQ